MMTLEPATPDQPLPRPAETLHLPLGLLGLEKLKQYHHLSDPQEAPFSWLQVVDEPNLAFLILPPADVLPEYRPVLSAEDLAFLGVNAAEEAQFYGIVTLRSTGKATINLKGPVAFNRQTRCGKQVILTNAAEYSLQHPLPLASNSENS